MYNFPYETYDSESATYSVSVVYFYTFEKNKVNKGMHLQLFDFNKKSICFFFMKSVSNQQRKSNTRMNTQMAFLKSFSELDETVLVFIFPFTAINFKQSYTR